MMPLHGSKAVMWNCCQKGGSEGYVYTQSTEKRCKCTSKCQMVCPNPKVLASRSTSHFEENVTSFIHRTQHDCVLYMCNTRVSFNLGPCEQSHTKETANRPTDHRPQMNSKMVHFLRPSQLMVTPILLAVPATIFMAASRFGVFKSGSFVFAISSTVGEEQETQKHKRKTPRLQ